MVRPIFWNFCTRRTVREGVFAAPLDSQVREDADDDVFLACAVAAKVKIVCSGDRHLLACDGWNDIEVLTPRMFYNLLQNM